MEEKQENLNREVKNCTTCVHCKVRLNEQFNHCRRYQTYCEIAIDFDCKLKDWQPKPTRPPRRSFRQWIYDTFWKVNK